MLEKENFFFTCHFSLTISYFSFFFTVSRRMKNYISGLESVKSLSHYRVVNKVGWFKSSASEKGSFKSKY